MGDVINLNRWRKEARKKAEAAAADESAVRHGRTKAQRRREADAERRSDERHEAHRLETPATGDDLPASDDDGDDESAR